MGLADGTPGPKEALHRLLPEEIEQIVTLAKRQEYADLSHRILAVTAWEKGLFFGLLLHRLSRSQGPRT